MFLGSRGRARTRCVAWSLPTVPDLTRTPAGPGNDTLVPCFETIQVQYWCPVRWTNPTPGCQWRRRPRRCCDTRPLLSGLSVTQSVVRPSICPPSSPLAILLALRRSTRTGEPAWASETGRTHHLLKSSHHVAAWVLHDRHRIGRLPCVLMHGWTSTGNDVTTRGLLVLSAAAPQLQALFRPAPGLQSASPRPGRRPQVVFSFDVNFACCSWGDPPHAGTRTRALYPYHLHSC